MEAGSGMETFLLIVVLVVLVALFAYVAYLYMKEAGSGGAQLWLTGSQKVRQSLGAVSQRPSLAAHADDQAPAGLAANDEGTTRQLETRDPLLAIDDKVLRDLREELQGELRRAAGRSREFDARLARIEHVAVDAPELSAQVSREIASVQDRYRVEIERLEVSLEAVRQRAGSFGERRGQALADLYGSLARVEASLAAIVNPMLLPGEPLSLPVELPAEAMTWDSWGDVAERAYALGNVFNENRLVLEAGTASDIERFIAILRQGLTGSVYPTVRVPRPAADQVAQMRAGLEAIAAALPAVRRSIEEAYRDA